jgi:hypothetical protein
MFSLVLESVDLDADSGTIAICLLGLVSYHSCRWNSDLVSSFLMLFFETSREKHLYILELMLAYNLRQ